MTDGQAVYVTVSVANLLSYISSKYYQYWSKPD